MSQFPDGYSSYYEGHYNGEDKATEISDEEEEKVNAIICFVFFLMGVGFMVGFIFVLVNFAQKNEQEQMGLSHISENSKYMKLFPFVTRVMVLSCLNKSLNKRRGK